ncbi:hypothetical protein SCA6_014308 [Theobroma cacao]
MSSKTFILLALLAAVVLLISSEVAARDLAETTTKINDALETTEVGTNDAKYGGYGGHGGYEGYDGYSGRSGYGGYGSAVAMADMVDVEGLEDAVLSIVVVLIIMEEVATSVALILARQSMLKLMGILTTNVAFARV